MSCLTSFRYHQIHPDVSYQSSSLSIPIVNLNPRVGLWVTLMSAPHLLPTAHVITLLSAVRPYPDNNVASHQKACHWRALYIAWPVFGLALGVSQIGLLSQAVHTTRRRSFKNNTDVSIIIIAYGVVVGDPSPFSFGGPCSNGNG